MDLQSRFPRSQKWAKKLWCRNYDISYALVVRFIKSAIGDFFRIIQLISFKSARFFTMKVLQCKCSCGDWLNGLRWYKFAVIINRLREAFFINVTLLIGEKLKMGKRFAFTSQIGKWWKTCSYFIRNIPRFWWYRFSLSNNPQLI